MSVYNFGVGEQVSFVSRDGREITGTVLKRGRKFLRVEQSDNPLMHWKVLPSQLSRTGAPRVEVKTARDYGFRGGDLVEFTTNQGMTVRGYIRRINSRTISVTPTTPGTTKYWRVAPELLKKV